MRFLPAGQPILTRALALALVLIVGGPTLAAASTVVSHISSVTHIAGAVQQAGAWSINVAHITSQTHFAGAVMLRNQAGTFASFTGSALDVNCTGCTAATSVGVTHITSVTHVAGTVTLAGGNASINQSGSWTIQATHQGGVWNVNHIGSVTHMAGVVLLRDGATTRVAHVNSSGELAVTCTGCSAAATVNVGHISGAVHLAGSVTDQLHSAIRVVVVTHVTVTGTIGHISSTTHVATTHTAPVHVVASTGSGNFVCHSTAAIHQTATSAIIAHGATGQRLFLCGVLLVAETFQMVSLVEGTAAGCGTSPRGVIGGTAASVSVGSQGGFAAVAAFPWIATAVAGNQLCLLKEHATGTVSGVVTYRGAP